MVKNTKGGNKSKGFARKLLNPVSLPSIRIPQYPMEQFAIVTQLFGNICDVLTLQNITFKCHIRGKFRGRNKRSSLISIGSIVIIGFRDYESTPKNTDLLEIFDSLQLTSLFSLPFDFSPFHLFLHHLNNHTSHINNHNNNNNSTSSHDDFVIFSHTIHHPTDTPDNHTQDNPHPHNDKDFFHDI